MLKLVKWIVSVFAEQWLLKIGGAMVASAASVLLFVFSTDGGVPWWIALFYSVLTLAFVTAIAFGVSTLAKRYSKSTVPIPLLSQSLSQQSVVVNVQSPSQPEPAEKTRTVAPEIECVDCYFTIKIRRTRA
jgi:thiol:disulfide interchange protein